MSEHSTSAGRPVDDLLAYCHWLVDAHEDGDPHQMAAARAGLYGQLVRDGWSASARASLLLRVHALTVAVEHDQLLAPEHDHA